MKFMKRKHKGGVDSFVVMLLCCIIMFGYIFTYIYFSKASDVSISVNSIARKYLLILESHGYLNLPAKVSLKLDLEKIGMKNVSLDGTTTSKQGFGVIVQLSIKGDFVLDEMNYTDGFKKGVITKHFDHTYKTTSKN